MTSPEKIVKGSRFGEFEFEEEDVIEFTEGLIGFSSITRYVLIAPKPESPFRWLQSIDEPALAFLVTDPANYVGDYAPPLSNTIAESLEIWEETPRMVLTTVNIPPGKPEEMTINLAGPLLVNAISRKGKQIVLEDDAYTTRYRVFHTADRMGDIVAA